MKNAYCACLKGVLPEGAGVGVGQLAGSVVPVASGHIRYVIDVEDGETGSWTFRPLTHPGEQNGGHCALLSRDKSHYGWRVSM